MPTPPRSQSLVTGAAGSFLAQSREREANHSESSTAERRSERATPKGVRVGSNAGSQPDDEVSDQFGFLSEAGLFWECSDLERNAMQRKIGEATKSWSVSRLCRCPGRHAEHRAHIAVALAGRSLAAIGVFGSDRAVLDCLDSLQPAERMQRELGSSLADAKWSAAAAKLASQCRSPASRSFAGGTVRMLGAKHECKYPLCDAGF